MADIDPVLGMHRGEIDLDFRVTQILVDAQVSQSNLLLWKEASLKVYGRKVVHSVTSCGANLLCITSYPPARASS